MRFKRQVHTLTIPWPTGILAELDLCGIEDSFECSYETLYGQGAAYREAGIEVTGFRLEAIGYSPKPNMKKELKNLRSASSDASSGTRPVFDPVSGDYVNTPVFDGDRLQAGHFIQGRAIVEYPGTTVVVYNGQRAVIDAYLNLIFEKEE